MNCNLLVLFLIALMSAGSARASSLACGKNIFLDQYKQIRISICYESDLKDANGTKARLSVSYGQTTAIVSEERLNDLLNNTTLRVNGKPLNLNEHAGNYKVFDLLNDEKQVVSVYVGEAKIIDGFQVVHNPVKPITSAPGIGNLNTDDLRILGKDGVKGLENHLLRKQALNPNQLQFSPKTTPFRNVTDLHTHYPGAMSARDLIEVGEKHHLRISLRYFEGDKAFKQIAAVADKSGTIDLARLGLVDYEARQRYLESLQIPTMGTKDFSGLEAIYERRKPFTKNAALFEEYLRRLADDYKKNGIKYVELSFKNIVEKEFYNVADRVIPQLDKEGVQIRFLVGHQRTASAKDTLAFYDEKVVPAARQHFYIRGDDLLGEEVNATVESAELLKRSRKLAAEIPGWQTRAHAGENELFPNNVKEAIEHGATRIGHGVFGVDDATIRLAREKNVIVEINANSNFALENITEFERLNVIRKYLDNGVVIVIGTDGHGMYCSRPGAVECDVARKLGLTEEDFKKMRQNEYAYIQRQSEAVDQMRARYNITGLSVPNSSSCNPIIKKLGQ